MHKIIGKGGIGPKAKSLIQLDNLNLTPDFIVIGPHIKSFMNDIENFFSDNRIIVRSSYAHEDSNQSYAGIFESYVCDLSDAAKYIEKVRMSTGNMRSKVYSKVTNGMAVIVQQYIPSDIGGVIFRIRAKGPVTLIEYANQPSDVVQGRANNSVVSYQGCMLFNKYSLHKDYILLQKVFKTVKDMPCDINMEFVVNADRVYIVQSRPLLKPQINHKYIFFGYDRRTYFSVEDLNKYWPSDIFEKHGLHASNPNSDSSNNIMLTYDDYLKVIESISANQVTPIIDDIRELHESSIKTIQKMQDIMEIIESEKKYYYRIIVYDVLMELAKQKFMSEKDSLDPYDLTLGTRELLDYLKSGRSHLFTTHIDVPDIKRSKLMKLLESRQEYYQNELKGSDKESIALKKLIWFHDANDHFIWQVTCVFDDVISKVLKKEGVEINQKDLCRLYAIPMDEFKDIAEIPVLIESMKTDTKITDTVSFPLTGISILGNDFSGVARIMKEGEEPKLEPDEILVCHQTHPSSVLAASIAVGIITEAGGITSHAAIISRELGIPCVVGVTGCMDAIKNGDRLSIVKGVINKEAVTPKFR